MKLLRKCLALLLSGAMVFSLAGVALAKEVREISGNDTGISEVSGSDAGDVSGGDAGLGVTVTLHALDVTQGQSSISDGNHTMSASEITEQIKAADGVLPADLDSRAPKMEGWTFKGWYTAPVKYAFWGDNTYTGLNAEDLPFEEDCDGQKYDFTVDKQAYPNASHTMTGYWYWLSSLEGKGSRVAAGQPLPEGKTDLYACYAPTMIEYKLDFCGWNKSGGVMTCTRQYGTPFGSEDVDREEWKGFVFDGWYSEDKTVGPLKFYDIPQDGVRYVAHWHSTDGRVSWENYRELGYSDVTGLTMKDGNPGSGMKDLGDTIQLHTGAANFRSVYVEVSPDAEKNGVTKLEWSVSGDTDAVRVEVLDEGLRATIYATDKAGTATVTVRSQNGCSDSVIVDTNGHAFDKSEVVRWGNCADPTVIRYTCVYCGKTEVRETYSKHVYAYRDVPATCTEPHKWIHYCKVCGELDPQGDMIRGQANGHDFKTFSAVGCGGTTITRVCQTCGYTETESDPSAAAHVWSDVYTVDKRPSCCSEGSQSVKCILCGAIKPDSSELIPADPSLHVWGAWIVESEADETKAGSQTRICQVCGTEEKRAIPPTSLEVDTSGIADGVNVAGSDQVADQAQANAALKKTVNKLLNDGSILGEDILYAAIQQRAISTEVCVTPVTAPENASDARQFNALLGNGASVIYMDIDIFVKAGGENIGRITETDGVMTFSAGLPAGGRIVTVLRAHEGTVEAIPCWVENGAVYFATDKFSTFAVSVSNDIAQAQMEIIPDQVYTGSEIRPAVRLTVNGGQILTEGVDYRLSYSNNVEMGTGTVLITGINAFAGSSREVTFRIVGPENAENDGTDESAQTGSASVWKPSKVDVDWDAVISQMDASSKGSNVTASVGTEFVIPTAVQKSVLKDKVTLACHADGTDITFTLSSYDMRKPKEDVVLSVSNRAEIPEEAMRTVTDQALFSRVLNIGEKKFFAQKLNLHMVMGRQYAGKMAVMYSYNELNGKMRFESSFRITENGLAMFPLLRGDEYVIVVADAAYVMSGSAGNYRVVSGDTLSGIALRNGITLRELLRANPQIKDANRIRAGEWIVVPGR